MTTEQSDRPFGETIQAAAAEQGRARRDQISQEAALAAWEAAGGRFVRTYDSGGLVLDVEMVDGAIPWVSPTRSYN